MLSSRGTWIRAGLLVALAAGGLVLVAIYPEKPPFQARIYTSPNGARMPYRLYIPAQYDARNKYPLVIYLHGYDAIGSDNQKQIAGYNRSATQTWITAYNQEKFPAFVVAPQADQQYWAMPLLQPPTRDERLVFEIIAALQQEFSLDEDRIYLTGQSMGGYGVYALLARRPDLFAGGIVFAGPALPSVASRIAHVPMWIFHGAEDDRVPVAEARRMVEALRTDGGQPRYSEYPDLGHLVSPTALREKDLLPWLFSQRRRPSP